ncbi:hypothetical protein ACLD43_03155 [Clostridium botulinum]|uniref:Lipoprotein n=1 Tax=Clostridium botulinum TaxID=1491 RepID=A0A846J2N0_CLOBO|nr:hypothetical protein [Clostridium botulinum]ACA57009.1 putative lipoprotein [Clostridium botulinum A3 str. Loch Maree]KEJ00426.1 hypothetical protein N494_05405 [Clostridium botulinum A2B7 92]NFH63881.1 hypothetical protein [Clostridium botulinum]NFJ07540.1 hypothetical protein [Clostridium botulinum]NFK14512.1 hypothetical protein [Clostridium botulinum]
MLTKKLVSLLLIGTIGVLLSACSTNRTLNDFKNGKDKDTLQIPIVHDVYNYNGKPNADVLSIFNSNGDVRISKSETNDLRVKTKLVQTKSIKDIDKKLNNLAIKPKIEKGVIFYEPLYTNNKNRNYWEWIKSSLNANGIQVNFDVQIPQTIKEVRIYSELGNINLQNISAKIHAQTNIGTITSANIDPLDSAVFKANIPSKGENALDLSLSSIDNVSSITAGVTSGDIVFNLPSGSEYIYNQMNPEQMPVTYPYDMYSKEQFEYCKKHSLEMLKPIEIKQGKTVIKTVTNKENLRKISIRQQ